MKIIVPYTIVHAALREVLDSLAIKVQFEYVGRNEGAYHALLSRLWLEGETFMIIEHDVLPVPGIVEEMWNCNNSWCGAQYIIGGGFMAHPLGFTKFDARMINAWPGLIDELPAKSWRVLDGKIYEAAYKAHLSLHPHGKVIHLNRGHFPK